MKLIMDMQAIQSESSKNRGIGRYSEELSINILKNKDLEINTYFNDSFSDLKDELDNRYLSINYYEIYKSERKNNYLNTFLYNYQFKNLKNNDILYIHSLFEGFEGKAVALQNFDLLNCNIAITLYDLIPLIFRDIYLQNENLKKWYYSRIKLLYEVDILFAISDATKEDAINILGLSEEKIINISGSIDDNKFYKIDKSILSSKVLKKFKIKKKFLMYTGGIDHRKNIFKSIEAFSKLDEKLKDEYQYVIVCKINDFEKNQILEKIKDLDLKKENIVFTGFVSDIELNELYNHAKLFIFPSIYEGFGLPVLEAMSCGIPVIGSNTSSLPEIIGRNDCLFDPDNINDIKNKIESLLNNDTLMSELKEFFYERSKKFTWENSARIVLDNLKKITVKKEKHLKPKIALFSPLPPCKSGISDYIVELIPYLSKYFEIDIFIDDYEVNNDYITYNYNIYNYRNYNNLHDKYEETFYHFGNSEFHRYMYDIAIKYPGIVVIHDFYLSGLVNYKASIENNGKLFFDVFKYSHPQNFDRKISRDEVIFKYPLNKEILDASKKIVYHSSYAKELTNEFYKGNNYDINVINQIIKIPSKKFLDNKSIYKEKINLKGKFIVSTFGIISKSKQNDFILKSMIENNLFNKYEHLILIFVGECSDSNYLEILNKLIKDNKLENRVIVTGFQEEKIYKDYLLVTDIAVNLRSYTRGETSRALLMNFAYKIPTIVNNFASFKEIPDDIVVKVEKDNEKSFSSKLDQLISNYEISKSISTKAYEYLIEHHNYDKIAKDFYSLLDKSTDIEIDYISECANAIVNDIENEDISIDYLKISEILKKC